MEELLAVLARFGKVTPELADALKKLLVRKTFKKREFILKMGETSNEIFYMEDGLVRIYSDGPAKEITIWILGKGAIVIGPESYFSREPSKYYIHALEPCIVWSISYAEQEELNHCFPEFKDIQDRVNTHYRNLSDAFNRMLNQSTAFEKYVWFRETHPGYTGRISDNVIMTYLKMSKHTFQRVRAEYHRKPNKLKGIR